MEKKEKDKKEENGLMKIFTKEQLADLLSDSWRKNTEMTFWLYNHHKDVLREWEKTQGNLQSQFLNGKKEVK